MTSRVAQRKHLSASARRRGASLVEMLVVVSLMSIVLGTVVVTLHSMFRADQQTRTAIERQGTTTRLALHVREDVHAARDARLSAADQDSAPSLTLELDDNSSIEYGLGGQGIDRLERRGDQIVHRDTFRLPAVDRVRWEIIELSGQPAVRMSLAANVQIEAVVARDRRFQRGSTP